MIYFPVWVDLYGEDNKTLWLTFLQVAVPLGVFLGYVVTALFTAFFSVSDGKLLSLVTILIVEMVILLTSNIIDTMLRCILLFQI